MNEQWVCLGLIFQLSIATLYKCLTFLVYDLTWVYEAHHKLPFRIVANQTSDLELRPKSYNGNFSHI